MENSLQSFIVPLWVVIGICLASGLHHVFVAFRREEGATNFAFALLCFAVALYAATNIGLYTSAVPELYRFYLKLQIGMSFLSGLAFLWFVAFYTQVLPWPILGLMTAYTLGVLAFHVSLPYGIFFENIRGLGEVRLAWSNSIVHYPLVTYASARTHFGDANFLFHGLFIAYACFRLSRTGDVRAALTLIACVILYFGSSIHDVALARHLLIDRPEVINRVPLQEYGFVSLVVLMSLRLSNEVLRVASIRQALVRSEQDLRITLDSIGDAVITTDANGCVTRMNPIAVDLTGWKMEEAVGMRLPEVFRIINARTREAVENPADKVLESGVMVGLANHTVLVNRDGTERQIADSGAPIRDRDGSVVGVVLVFRDVTRQYQLEDQLRHSQKMEAVGRLASGVAHDFNNLLQAIQGYTSLALSQVGDGGRTRNDLQEVLRTADRAGVLVRQLLSFCRKEAYQPRLVDFNRLISDMEKLLRRAIGINTELRLHFSEHLAPVYADRGQMEQVLMNLCINARDALTNGGEIRIHTQNVKFDEEISGEQPWAQPGEYVLVSISDDGVGMSPEIQSRIFEPYFTTKERGEGTGLGLATVFAIIERHAGIIRVTSVPGHGSTFSVYLPVAEQSLREGTPAPVKDSTPEGSGTILVAEDEEVVRNLVIYTLEGAGYRVFAAEDGEIAKAIFDERPSDFDAAVVDLIMPRLGGRALYDHIRSVRADLPVVFSSGYSPEGLDRLTAEDPRTVLLQKPHPATELLNAIRSLMDQVERV